MSLTVQPISLFLTNRLFLRQYFRERPLFCSYIHSLTNITDLERTRQPAMTYLDLAIALEVD